MLVSKKIDKATYWLKTPSDLDNIAYQLYLDENSYKGAAIYPQNMMIYFHDRFPESSKYYDKAIKILRKQKLDLLNEKR